MSIRLLDKYLYAAANKRDKRLADFVHPPCSVCGGEVEKYPGEPAKSWRARKTCSQACKTAQRAAYGQFRARRASEGPLFLEDFDT